MQTDERNKMYVNVGVRSGITDIKTKKTLKELISENPSGVTFYETSIYGTYHGGEDFNGEDLKDGINYSVCGPNPFTDRRWYATVKLEKGKIKVM